MSQAVRKGLVFAAGLAAAALMIFAEAPEGWFVAGTKPSNYDTGLDKNAVFGGRASAYMTAKSDGDGFGTLMQQFSAAQYLGKRVQLSAWVKSENVTRWAGLWMRVDGSSRSMLAFDNMQNRPIKGTTGWQQYQVTLDVSEKATGIAFGILLDGPGEVWINSANFQIVSATVPTTGRLLPDAPANLSFEK